MRAGRPPLSARLYGAGVRPTLCVTLPTFGDVLDRDWRRLLDLAVAAEEAGVDRIVVPEHVVLGRTPTHTRGGPSRRRPTRRGSIRSSC